MEEVDNPPASSCRARLPAGDPQTPEKTGLRREKGNGLQRCTTATCDRLIQPGCFLFLHGQVGEKQLRCIPVHTDTQSEKRGNSSDQGLDHLSFLPLCYSQQMWSEHILGIVCLDHFTDVDFIVRQGVTDDVELEHAERLRELLHGHGVAWNQRRLRYLICSFIQENIWVVPCCVLEAKGNRNIRT